MAIKLVKTINGEEIEDSLCHIMGGDYFKIGDPTKENSGDCYKINGRFYKSTTDGVVYDHEEKVYILRNAGMVEGVIAVDSVGNFTMGYFTPNKITNIHIIDKVGFTFILLNEEVVKNNRIYRYNKQNDSYAHHLSIRAERFASLPVVDNRYKNSLEYDCRNVIPKYVETYNANPLEANTTIKQYANALKDLTFGFEFETVEGKVPDRLAEPLGLIPLRDGSVAGLEYATIPLQGEKGMQAVVDSCKVLDKFTRFDPVTCSLHLHIGNVPRTKEFLLSLFKVLAHTQEYFFSMFPLYKQFNFGVKRKNYTKPFPVVDMLSKMSPNITKDNVDENFKELFSFLSMGQDFASYGNDLDKVLSHPSDPRGTSKWQIKSRYHWVNLIPLVFGNKATVEFRIHTPTNDVDKVMDYLFLCGALVNFAKDNQKTILETPGFRWSLNDIIYNVYNEHADLGESLGTYIYNRRQHTKQQNSNGDIVGDELRIKRSGYFKWDQPIGRLRNTPRRRGGAAGAYAATGLAAAIARFDEEVVTFDPGF